MMWLRCLLATATVNVLAAQDLDSAQREHGRMQKELLESTSRAARLLDLRVRHDLGLRIDGERYYGRTESELGQSEPDCKRQLAEGELEVVRLGSQLESMQRELETRCTQAANQARSLATQTESPLVPFAVAEPEPGPPAHQEPPAEPLAAATQKVAVPERQTPRATSALIRGSLDHGLVGRALFKAGRFAEARTELEKATASDSASFVDLFQLARCCEQLGDHEAARKLYLTIEAKDTPKGGAPTGGSWAQAARSARRAMSWAVDRGQWQPSTSVESLRLVPDPAANNKAAGTSAVKPPVTPQSRPQSASSNPAGGSQERH